MVPEIKVTTSTNGQNSPKSTDHKIKLTFLTCDRFVRVIIGKGGNSIKKLIENSKCQIIIKGKRGTLRYLTIEGDRNDVPKAIQEISALIIKSVESLHDLDTEDDNTLLLLMLLPKGVSGPIIGKQGENINSIKQASGADLRIFSGDSENHEQDHLIIEGTPMQIKNAMVPIATIYSECATTEPLITENESSYLSTTAHRCMSSFEVESDIAPIIIGKSGSVIKKIRRTSGAGIHVNPSERKDVIIDVFGEQSSIDYAIRIIDIEIKLGFRRRSRTNSKGRGSFNSPSRSGRVLN